MSENDPQLDPQLRALFDAGRAEKPGAHATAKGIRIELSDFSEGANYFWKIEEKKKD